MAITIHVSPSADISLNLVLAVIASSNAPLLLLDGDCRVIAVSTSFCRTFQVEQADAPGCLLFNLGAGEWDVRQLRSLLNATAAGNADIEAYEMDFKPKGGAARCLVVNAKKLAYASGEAIRLIVTVSDVTDARIAERIRQDLAREMADIKRDKAMLLQELQHRVANSLQIIASVLMQTARRVQSDETRRHLHDAHHRVMSVAALQKQLAVSTMGDVQLRSYFTDLCQSIGASMISDHDQISLETNVDDSVITADVSVSLGLVVTELVINALKHAFPEARSGKITVSYHSQELGWTLMVGDNGVGMPKSTESARAGLGTSIVNALARQLKAEVTVANTNPGTTVSLVHVSSDPEGDAVTLSLKRAV
jgi:two-component system, sensor histidine kinase PdtaS